MAEYTNVMAKNDQSGYNEMADDYEEEVKAAGYQAPSVAGKTLAEYIKENRDCSAILDIGGGTGLLGEELRKEGFKTIDILDASKNMLTIARQKQIYRRIVCMAINGVNSTSFENDTYEAVVICGAHSRNQSAFKCEDTMEFIRITKPGGLIIIVTRTEYLYAKKYRNRLIPLFEKLEADKKWKELRRSTFANYIYGVQGQLFVYQKQ